MQSKSSVVTTSTTTVDPLAVWAMIAAVALGLGFAAAILVWDDLRDHVQNELPGIRIGLGITLVIVGMVVSVASLLAKVTKTEKKAGQGETQSDADNGFSSLAAGPALPVAAISAVAGLLDKAGGVGVFMMLVGALLIGVQFSTEPLPTE